MKEKDDLLAECHNRILYLETHGTTPHTDTETKTPKETETTTDEPETTDKPETTTDEPETTKPETTTDEPETTTDEPEGASHPQTEKMIKIVMKLKVLMAEIRPMMSNLRSLAESHTALSEEISFGNIVELIKNTWTTIRGTITAINNIQLRIHEIDENIDDTVVFPPEEIPTKPIETLEEVKDELTRVMVQATLDKATLNTRIQELITENTMVINENIAYKESNIKLNEQVTETNANAVILSTEVTRLTTKIDEQEELLTERAEDITRLNNINRTDKATILHVTELLTTCQNNRATDKRHLQAAHDSLTVAKEDYLHAIDNYESNRTSWIELTDTLTHIFEHEIISGLTKDIVPDDFFSTWPEDSLVLLDVTSLGTHYDSLLGSFELARTEITVHASNGNKRDPRRHKEKHKRIISIHSSSMGISFYLTTKQKRTCIIKDAEELRK